MIFDSLKRINMNRIAADSNTSILLRNPDFISSCVLRNSTSIDPVSYSLRTV